MMGFSFTNVTFAFSQRNEIAQQISEFVAKLEIIGINPYVSVPEKILTAIQAQVGKDKGQILIKGTINGKTFRQIFNQVNQL